MQQLQQSDILPDPAQKLESLYLKGQKRLHIFWTNSYQNGPLWDGARMQAHPLSVLRGGRVAQASTALHYCAKAALHSV